MDYADLHVHSYKSDGLLSPEQIVDYGIKKGLRCIALTDHDNVEGISDAVSHASNKSIEIVPGIELSTEFEDTEVHILGYFINYEDTGFKSFLKKLSDSRFHRAERMVKKLNNLGITISFEDVCKTAHNAISVGRPHIARVMVNRGKCSSVEEVFEKYIGFGKPAYVERYKISPVQAVEAIKKSGGVSSIAHPGLTPNINMKLLAKRLKEWGLCGIEVYHSKHTPKDVSFYGLIAEELNLVKTGGSDCHGVKVEGELLMGTAVVPYENVLELKRRAGNYINNNLLFYGKI